MSLDTLRKNIYDQAAGKAISINAATFTLAGLSAPDGLDALLKGVFGIDPLVGLQIATTQEDVGPVVGGTYFDVKGTIDVAIAKKKTSRVRFSASGNQGGLIIAIELGDKWTFGESFTGLAGRTFDGLGAKTPYFYFAGQKEAAFPYPYPPTSSSKDIALERGLNFAGTIALTGYLKAVLDILPGMQPQPSYLLSGTVDPAIIGTKSRSGRPIVVPGLRMATTKLATGTFTVGYLTVEGPSIEIFTEDFGDPAGFTPLVTLTARLQVVGGAQRPEFRLQVPSDPNSKLASFAVADPDGGLVLTADQLFGLMAGETWFNVVPPSLSQFLQSFGFRSFGITVGYANGLSIRNVQAIVASGTPWRVIDDPLLELRFELDWSIMNPFQSGQSQFATLTAFARFMPELFPGEFFFSIDTALVVSGGYEAANPSEWVNINKLVEAVTGGFIKIPEQFLVLYLQEFFVTVDQPNRFFSMGATTTIKLPIVGPGKFELNEVRMRLSVQKPQKSGGASVDSAIVALAPQTNLPATVGADVTRYTGSISGNLVIGPVYLFAEASYASEIWNFRVAMQPGTRLSLQDMIDAIFDDVALPTDIFSLDVQIFDVSVEATVPSDKAKATEYRAAGSIIWDFSILGQSIKTTATVNLNYKSDALPNKFTGKVTALTTFNIFGIGATFLLGYEIKNDPITKQGTQILFLTWEGLTAKYIQGSGQQTIEFTADATWNLGRLINTLVRIVVPSASKDLPPPWNLLNNISLSGLSIKFNLTTKEVTVSWPLKVDLFFGKIESLNIIKRPGQQVEVTLTGNFLFSDQKDQKWDAVTQDPPQVPGGGDSWLDLRLVALGQHVTVPDLSKINTVNDAVDQLKGFKQVPAASRKLPIGPGIPKGTFASQFAENGNGNGNGASGAGSTALAVSADTGVMAAEPAAPLFSRDSNWLVGLHFFAVSNTLDLKIIFNDPVLYGIRIGLAGPKAKIFAGLEFEIMYKKISDSIGVYKILLKLPDAMRYLQFGQVTIILPVVGLEIYTNGNFKVDFGFPYNMDFSRSFTVQVFPFTGSGGFYFGWLNGTTSSQVPKNTPCGNFDPVIEFGLGMNVGLGKSLSLGILKAEISVVVFGILEGVVAVWQAYDNSHLLMRDENGEQILFGPDTRSLAAANGGDADVEKAYYYKITGTLGVIGKVVGVVDFAIIKAEVSLTVYAYIQGTFEAYRKSVVLVEAGVKVSLKFTINCGFFKITINLSFSATIRESFTIGKDRLEEAPWYCGGSSASRLMARPAPLMSLGDAVRLYAAEPNFAPLKTPAGGVRTLDVYFLPQLSIEGEGRVKADQKGVYSINLFMSNLERSDKGETYRSFERLARDTYLWIASSFSGRSTKGTPDEELAQATTVHMLKAAREYLTANSDGRSLTYQQVAANLAALFMLQIGLPPTATTAEETAAAPESTAFPMGPELTLNGLYKGATVADVDFTNWATADQAYLEKLQVMINKLIAQMLDELEQQNGDTNDLRAFLRRDTVGTQSLASFVFVDWFAMAAQYVVQGAIDALENYLYALGDGDSITSVRIAFNAMGDGAQNRLTDESIAWMNRDHPLSPNLKLTIDAVPYRIQDGDTWGGIAAKHGLDVGAMAAQNAAVQQVLIPGMELTIDGVKKPVPNEASIALTAAEFGKTPAEFGQAIATMEKVLQPLTSIVLNGLSYTTPGTAGAVRLTSLAETFGIDIPTLTPSVAGVGNLFDRTSDANLILSGLEVLTNARLWGDILDHGGVDHLSGMAGRYLLNGLRLPVNGITFKNPSHSCNGKVTCGLENLTGQQFPLPSLSGYDPADPLTITLANPRGLTWISFTNPVDPNDPTKLPFKVPAEAAKQVNDLVAQATGTGLQAPIDQPEALRLAEDRPRHYTFRNNIILQTPAPIPLPNDNLPEGTTPRPRIWNFPNALMAQLARKVALAPQFSIQIGSTNTDGGRIIPRPARSYGFGTLINVSIKRAVIVTDTGAITLPTTYELIGADEVGVNQLEQLLGAISPEDASIINGIYFLTQPNQTSDRAQGLQYDGEQNYAAFLVQANLSSETNPPSGPALKAGALGAPPLRGLLNSFYQFLNRLWSGSIVRSGGYYFSYELADGSGLPETIFNNDNVATISVLVVYNPLEGITGDGGGLVEGYMNVAVVDDPIDDTNDVVYVQSEKRSASVDTTTSLTLAEVAAEYHLGVIEIAQANLKHALTADALVHVTDIVHQVGRGETLAVIEAKYGKTEAQIKAANPNVDFANLKPGTGLHIPDLTTKAKSGTPGITLPEIARYYNTTVDALAWANRDAKGLYAVGTPLTFEDRLIDKEPTLPSGNVGLVVRRRNPAGDPSNPAVYLEQAYNLLGYDLITNNDFTAIPDALPLPSGPTEDVSEDDVAQLKPGKPMLAAADDDWRYVFTVPASRAARDNPVPASTTETPYPDRTMNPYAGVGGFLQLELDWRDMLGNHTWSPFDNSSASNNYPLNDPPSRFGFTDDVIGLGAWPSTQYDHIFRTGTNGPELTIDWSFDPSRYEKQTVGTGETPWEQNAKADRQVFANLYYQLVQTYRLLEPQGSVTTIPATKIETITSMAGDAPVEISSTERTSVVDYVLTAWRYVVKVLKNGGVLPPPADLPKPISIVRSIDPAKVGTITEITVALRVRRVDPAVLDEFRDDDGSRLAETKIGPRLVQTVEGETNAGYTLDFYTKQFEEAFRKSGEYAMRLATGVPRDDVGAGAGRDTLWSVRFGDVAAQAYYYRLKEPAMFFAPAPLSTTLISRNDVTLYSFTADGGLSANPDVTQSFTGIDLDVWGRGTLAAIDRLLSPLYAVPAFLVDRKASPQTHYLQDILDQKFALAGAIVKGVTNILCEPKLTPESNPENFAAAREKLRQQLLIELENAYAVDAVVQYNLDVTSPTPASEVKTAPRLYGNPVDPNQSTKAKDYSASSFKIPLVNGSSLLTYAFRARDTSRQASFPLTLTYAPTHIEHEITSIPGIDEYQASSWLNFLNPLPPIQLGTETNVPIDIPIALRAYPTPPSLQNQTFTRDDHDEDPTTTLEKAKEWTFRFIYSQAHAAQDRIDSVVRFNVPIDQGLNAALGLTVDLFTMLARITHVLPQIQEVFENDLLRIKLDTDPESAGFKRAKNALSAFATLVKDLDVAWGAWVDGTSSRASLMASGLNQTLPFSVLEDETLVEADKPEGGTEDVQALRVTIAYPAELPPNIAEPPIVTFEGYEAVEVDPEGSGLLKSGAFTSADHSTLGLRHMLAAEDECQAPDASILRKAWVYKKIEPKVDEAPYLTWDQALTMPERRVDIRELDAIQYQNAWANVRIIRNADLVGPGNPTRAPFIYRTPIVQFRNKLTPLLDTSKEINIATVPSGAKQKRTMPEHLTALLSAFFKGSPSQEQLVKLEVRYQYSLGTETQMPNIELPVAMVPPTEFEIPPDWQELTRTMMLGAGSGEIGAGDFIGTVSERITTWFKETNPSKIGGRFLFDLSAFSSLSNNSQPLVRVRNLTLEVVDVVGI